MQLAVMTCSNSIWLEDPSRIMIRVC